MKKRPSRRSRFFAEASIRSIVETLESRLLLSAYVVTNLNDSGAGSLRGDILMSNGTGGANTITFAPGLSGTITLTSGQLEISSNLTIIGPTVASLFISGNDKSRVFQIDANSSVSISGLTVTGGHAPQGPTGTPANPTTRTPGGDGGQGGNGGGIDNLGSLALVDDVITGNTTGSGGVGGPGADTGFVELDPGNGGPGGSGGGIFSAGPLSISTCTVSGNTTGNGGAAGGYPAGGGGGGGGGGIFATGQLTITNSTIDGNSAGSGGGSNLFEPGPGGSGGSAGGIYAGGDTVMIGSTISRNRAGNGVGPINSQGPLGNGGAGGGIVSWSKLALINCTISGNGAGNGGTTFYGTTPGNGGGINSNGPLHLTNVTVAGNSAPGAGAGLFVTGGSILSNTIVADTVHGGLDPASSHNLIGANGRLGALGNYGGTTQTIPLLPGSAAIDAGSNALAVGPDGQPLLTDQRGLPRIVNGTVDIGAYEVQQTPVVNTTDDETTPGDGKVSLREALQLAEVDHGPEIGAITFDPTVFTTGTVHTINLTQGQLELGDLSSLTIRGPGAGVLTINAGGSSRVFKVDAGVTATISGLTITGGSADQGGAISNSGTLSIDGCALTGNLASKSGGAIYNGSGGQLAVSNSTFSSHSAAHAGGGIYNAVSGQLLISNSTFWGNSAAGGSPDFPTQLAGGAIANAGGATVTNCTIANNSATGGSQGGGIANAAALSLQNTLVADNTGGDVAGTLASSSSYNLVGDGSGGVALTLHNLFGTSASPLDAKLALLGDYGGPLQTVALLPGSPAIDAGSNFLAQSAHLSQDERGFPRVANSTVDIGAYEAQSLIVVNTTADETTAGDASLSLREAVALADADKGPEAITISFNPIQHGTITLTAGQLELSRTTGKVTIDGGGGNVLTISGNNASRVLQVDAGVTAEIDHLTITAGRADQGGGVLNLGALMVSGSTFAGNSATNAGGGIFNGAGASLVITNSTFSGNSGSAISNAGTLTATNVTIAGNSGPAAGGGGGIATTGTATLFNTIVANNMGGDVTGTLDPSSSHNLIGVDPKLAALANYGGPTPTLALEPSSPAIDAGDNALTQAAGLTTDQRGLPRVANGTVDIGAYEVQPSLVVNTTADEATSVDGKLSLREAVAIVNAAPAEHSVTFAPSLSGATNLVLGPLNLANTSNQITIRGPGSAALRLNGKGEQWVFTIAANVTAEIDGLEISGAAGGIENAGDLTLAHDLIDGNVSAGGVINSGTAMLSDSTISGNSRTGDGGGISNAGTINVSNCTIANNNATYNNGGGIYNGGSASITLSGSRITGNSAGFGGGIFNNGSLTVTNSTLSGNSAQTDGGGIFNRGKGTLTLANSTITGDSAQTSGGGIFNNGTLTLSASTVSNSTAQTGGGGIYNVGTLNLVSSSIITNTAMTGGGGGLYNDAGGPASLANSTISGNQTHGAGGGVYNRGNLTFTNCTIADNTSLDSTGGGLNLSGGVASAYNTIVADNHNLIRPDIAGSFDFYYVTNTTQYTRPGQPSSHDLIADGSGGLPLDPNGDPTNGNLLGTPLTPLDPRLAPLGNYGGPTQTMVLRSGSPAIDAGANALAIGPDGTPLLTDQRGLARIFNATVDIGACEFGSHLLGDADGDGKVDFADLVIVARNYGKTNATWADGDFNNDGSVGFDDLLIVARNYGKSISLTTAAAAMLSASVVGAPPFSSLGMPSDIAGLPHRRLHRVPT